MLFSKEWQWLRDDFSDGSQMPTRILYTMTISFKKEKKKRHFRKTKKKWGICLYQTYTTLKEIAFFRKKNSKYRCRNSETNTMEGKDKKCG